MMDILSDVKTEDPEVGLVVIVDEISDFLKQKSKEDMSYDLALLRELGEVSQDSDFLYIGAMQEHVFTNAKLSIKRKASPALTSFLWPSPLPRWRFSSSDQPGRAKRCRSAFAVGETVRDYRQYFPNLANQTERYINLFPIHPYVIVSLSSSPTLKIAASSGLPYKMSNPFSIKQRDFYHLWSGFWPD